MSIQHPTRQDSQAALISRRQELAARIEAYVHLMSHGRIRGLSVVCLDGVIILQGRSRTQHDKQVAQEAAIETLQGRDMLVNHIAVRKSKN